MSTKIIVLAWLAWYGHSTPMEEGNYRQAAFSRRKPLRSDGALAQLRLATALADKLSEQAAQKVDTGHGVSSGHAAHAGNAGRTAHEGSPKKLSFLFGILRFILFSVLAVHAWYIVTTSLLILTCRVLNPPASVIMVYRAVLYGWKLEPPKPLPLAKIPLYIRSMLVSVEDGKFYTHHGLDFEAFKRAREINAIVGRPLYGGSTLTMQVARTLFLVPEKSYIRKYFEIITALELEAFLGKDRILELYFGYAEWGKGLFGIEAASRRYYKKSVASLSRDEAARLVALLSSPIKYNPSTLSRSGILRERYAYLSRRYVSGGAQLPDQSGQLVPPPQGIEPSAADNEDGSSGSGPAGGSESPESAPSGASTNSPDGSSGAVTGAPDVAVSGSAAPGNDPAAGPGSADRLPDSGNPPGSP